ncbi:MAG: septum formation initiator family protein [Gammaproteobacteria bacterium]|jgi:cell division protein FtsB|nr:cell division protein FtsB [Gammaproteobacteria bacterium]MAR60753.1 cell division protein FtsB [Gammaproteobacteria bacterium]MCH2472881.1 septum formation initiator family protein [Gammaproteobacteria bacterium]|tara:strand:- start:1728 stop:1997 length:270 start_codon:yes stop_codon:yes gene_type:complete
MRILTLILIIIFILLQMDIWFKEDGKKRTEELNQMIDTQQQENKEMMIRNSELEQEIKDLKDGTEALEEKARTEMGMIKEGEELYLIAK